MLAIYLTDVNNVEATRQTSGIIKVKTIKDTDAEILLDSTSDANTYMGGTIGKYHLSKVSICPTGSSSIKYKYEILVSFDGENFYSYKSVDEMSVGDTPVFVDNLLDWYGYITEHPVKIVVSTDEETAQEFYVHIVYKE